MDHTSFYLDKVGQVIVKDLCELKKKHDKKEAELKFYKSGLLLASVLFLVYVLFFSVVPYRFHFSSMITVLINNVYNYFFIALIVTFFYRMKFIEKKAESAEKEYNALRCEVIQRTEELWPDVESRQKRHLFLKEMKDKYNINLYYEND